MQPARFQYDLTHCPIGRALDLLGERWTLLVVREAIYGVRRFDDFARALACGRGVLSDRLKRLTEAGVLERRAYVRHGQRPRPEYVLTDKGRDLFPALLALSQWSERWSPPPEGPVALVTARGRGEPVEAILTADPYARRLTLHDVDIAPGPGAKRIK
ncbi:MAG TPA: helix-turn-helix domain-containing protein [Caulobacteraceae bacterium]|nr:helix-turn-helix domain-containing protein [Caulobacteraceae bacterium]